MNFKEWFFASEMRKPYKNYMARMFPDMPSQVRHELGTNTVIPQIKKMANRGISNFGMSPPIRNKNQQFGTTVPYQPQQAHNPYDSTVLANSGSVSRTTDPTIPVALARSTPEEMIKNSEKVKEFQNADWPQDERGKKGEVIEMHFTDLDPSSQETAMKLKFGYADNIEVRRHQQRMQDQLRLIKEKPVESMEPAILIKYNNGYKIMEGWHRMFNYMLLGAPPEEAAAIMNGSLSPYQANYGQWKPVKVNAIIGIPKNQRV